MKLTLQLFVVVANANTKLHELRSKFSFHKLLFNNYSSARWI